MKPEERRLIRNAIVKRLEHDNHFICLTDTLELFMISPHEIYVAAGIPERLITEAIRAKLGEEYLASDSKEAEAMVQADSYVDSDFFNKDDPYFVKVRNGVLDLRTGTLEPHKVKVIEPPITDDEGKPIETPEEIEHSCQTDWELENLTGHHFRNFIDIAWMPDAKCPAIDKFLHEITNSEAEVQTLYEFFGYCLFRDYFIHKAFMLVGDGANGKTTLLNLLNIFLGTDNIANIDLQTICHEKFSMAELRGKMANIYDDLKYNALNETGRFKILTGNGLVDAELKFVQRRTKFRNYAKMIFSTNQIPVNRNDDTSAFWRRWIILQFINVFNDDKGNCDKHLIDKLTVKEELEGLLVKAVEGLRRLLKNEKFSYEQTIEDTKASWTRDTLKDFVQDCIELQIDAFEAKSTVYEAFKVYCENNNGIMFDERTFSMKLRHEVALRDGQATINGTKGIHVYYGIRLKQTSTQSPLLTIN